MSLFQRLFGGRRSSASAEPVARTTGGPRIYVFGDVHGRNDLFDGMLAAIIRDMDAAPPPAEGATVVGLGDYVDRGPDVKAVIDGLIAGVPGCRTVFLRGNHEQMLLDFIENPVRDGLPWLANGGPETLRSYGVPSFGLSRPRAGELEELRHAFVGRIPPAHLMLLQRLPVSFSAGTYFFAHAGARPGIPLDEQDAQDLIWIRKGFADADAWFEKVVVHGHTPVDEPYFGPYRINIDTGAWFSDNLTCLVLEGAQCRPLVF